MSLSSPLSSPSWTIALLSLVLQLCWIEGKVHTGTVQIGSAYHGGLQWHFLSKFGYAIGTGTYEIRLRFRDTPSKGTLPKLDLEVFLDEDWAKAESLPPCERAHGAPARKIHRLLDVGPKGEWGPWEGGQLIQNIRPHIWYFALSSCHRGYDTSIPYEIEYELRMNQFDGSELSVEMRHMLPTNVLALIGLTVFLAQFSVKCRRFHYGFGSLHPVIRGLVAAVALQWLAQAFHAGHLWAYQVDGIGEPTRDALSEVLFMLSQVVTSTLLIAIAHGYTLLSSQVDDLSGGHKSGAIAVVGAAAVIHTALVVIGKMYDNASHKHHENEGRVGWLLLVVRVMLYLCFMRGVANLQQTAGFRLQCFLRRFQFVGSLYFLAYPSLFVIVQVFAQYLRHPIMQIGLLTMQTTSALWMADLFLARGAYYEVSTLSASLLPGGSRSFCTTWRKED